MSSNRVFYLISGPSHLPYLVTSIWSLRTKSKFAGEVVVFAWPESFLAAKVMSLDKSLGITLVERTPRASGHNSHFLEKIHLMQEHAGKEGALFIDADTLPVQPIDCIFDILKVSKMIAVQFSDWTTQKRTIKNRLTRIAHLDECRIDLNRCLGGEESSINNGVLACTADSKCLTRWAQLTEKVCATVFIPDEICLHPIVASDDFAEEGVVLSGDSGFNTSPKYQHPSLKDEDVKIWHFHGDSNVRPIKSPKGFGLWWPAWEFCANNNVGNSDQWFVPQMNRWMNDLYS